MRLEKSDGLLWNLDSLEVNHIPLGTEFGEDKLIWHYTPNGVYTVRSGHYLAMNM